jgi:hypothetical protein
VVIHDVTSGEADYAEFIAGKIARVQPAGFDWPEDNLPAAMFDWQKRGCLLALKRGRCALFLNTGLGKTLVQLAWASAVAEHTGRPVLLLCPLAVGPLLFCPSVLLGSPVGAALDAWAAHLALAAAGCHLDHSCGVALHVRGRRCNLWRSEGHDAFSATDLGQRAMVDFGDQRHPVESFASAVDRQGGVVERLVCRLEEVVGPERLGQIVQHGRLPEDRGQYGSLG